MWNYLPHTQHLTTHSASYHIPASYHTPASYLRIPASYLRTPTSQVALVVKNPPGNSGDMRDTCLISRWGRSPGEGNGNPFQYSCLGNPMDRRAWRATVHRITRAGHDLVTKPAPEHLKTAHVYSHTVYVAWSPDTVERGPQIRGQPGRNQDASGPCQPHKSYGQSSVPYVCFLAECQGDSTLWQLQATLQSLPREPLYRQIVTCCFLPGQEEEVSVQVSPPSREGPGPLSRCPHLLRWGSARIISLFD